MPGRSASSTPARRAPRTASRRPAWPSVTASPGGVRPRSRPSRWATAPASSGPRSRRSTPTSPSPKRRRRSRCSHPRVVVAHPEHEDVAARRRRAAGARGARHRHRLVRRRVDDRAAARREQRGRRATCSSPAARPACRRARCSRTGPPGCAPSSATSRRARPDGAARSSCSASSTWPGGTSSRTRWPPIAPSTSCAVPIRRSCSPRSSGGAPAGSTASLRCGNASSSAATATTPPRWSRCSPGRRSSVST